MQKVSFIIILLLISMSCKKKSSFPLELEILNKELKVNRDDLKIQLINNSNNDYLLYFNHNKVIFQDLPQRLSLNIVSQENVPVKTVFSISDPIWILDEETGELSVEDSISEKKYFDCIGKNAYVILQAKKKLRIEVPFIDSIDECGRKNYPILEKNKLYKLTLKMNIDSNLIAKKELENIRIKYKHNIKVFQGKLVSNTININ